MTNSEQTKSPLKVSIIIPTYNESTALSETLTRLQQHQPFEIIIGDGGSEDDTADIARRYEATVVQSPRGRAAQMNAAAGEAKGDLLLFLHADSYVAPRGYQKMIETMASGPYLGGAFSLQIDSPPARSQKDFPLGELALPLPQSGIRRPGHFHPKGSVP